MGRAKSTAGAKVLADGTFGAFVLDQLSGLGDVVAKPMFGGAGFYLSGEFFGLLYKDRLYFRVSDDTIKNFTARKMKPFAPFAHKGRPGSHGYYEVPIDILESADDLVQWARAAHQVPPLTTKRPIKVRGKR